MFLPSLEALGEFYGVVSLLAGEKRTWHKRLQRMDIFIVESVTDVWETKVMKQNTLNIKGF